MIFQRHPTAETCEHYYTVVVKLRSFNVLTRLVEKDYSSNKKINCKKSKTIACCIILTNKPRYSLLATAVI